MIRRTILILLCMPSVVAPALAKDVGTFGNTYPIVEKDALTETQERAAQIDWKKVLDRKKLEKYQGPADRISLPRAKRDRVHTVDMTYVTEIDVPDGRGGILYPAGYRFNPLDYLTYPKTIIVINGNDPAQVKWFKESGYSGRVDVMLMITEGTFAAISKQVNCNLFYANAQIINRFQLHALPSIVRQKGRVMEVAEVLVQITRTGKGKS